MENISPFSPYDNPNYKFDVNSPGRVDVRFMGRINLNDLYSVDSEGYPPLATALGEYQGSDPLVLERISALSLFILEKTRNPNPSFVLKKAYIVVVSDTPEEEEVVETTVMTPPIFHAIRLGLTDVVKKMVELGVDKNLHATVFGKPRGGTPLEEAQKGANKEIIEILERYYSK